MNDDASQLIPALDAIRAHAQEVLSQPAYAPLPRPADVHAASESLFRSIPKRGLGLDTVSTHLREEVARGLNGASLASRYYGFVIGGVTPAARVGEALVSLYDQNVHVHLADQSVATAVEDAALRMLLELLRFGVDHWPLRTLTTGATAGNIIGLAAGRDAVLKLKMGHSAEGMGVLEACGLAGIRSWQVLTSCGHSSLYKAANVVGLGRAAVAHVGRSDRPVAFDMEALEARLARPETGSIVVVSCGEVNTGDFATRSEAEMQQIRALCDQYGAWLHVDGAFGVFARCLMGSESEFHSVSAGGAGIELADSLSGDGHKMLNLPYDCGFFFSRHKQHQMDVFQNPNASYLPTAAMDIPAPLNIGLENSRRFRGLPLYASLLAYGEHGYRDMLERQVRLARKLAQWIQRSEDYSLLPEGVEPADMFMVVLFRPNNPALNDDLVKRINATRRIYVSGTAWQGEAAVRMAIANWQTSPDTDFPVVIDVLHKAARE